MDDLRERLEAALSEAQFQAQHLANDATRTARWEAHTATLREALDHPERLMVQVAEITYSNWNGMNVEMTHHAAGKVPVGTKLYAKEVKP